MLNKFEDIMYVSLKTLMPYLIEKKNLQEADPNEDNLLLECDKLTEESEPSKIINVTNEDSIHSAELSAETIDSADSACK